jgi:hypothetical protein
VIVVGACAPLFCLCTQTYGQVAKEDKVLERFFAEAPKKWDEYRGLSKVLQGNLKGWARVKASGKVSTSSWEDQIKQNETGALVIRTLLSKHEGAEQKSKVVEKESAHGQNSQYSFHLLKKKDGWLLVKVNLDPKTPVTERQLALAEEVFESTSPHFFLLGQPLSAALMKKLHDGPNPAFTKGVIVEKQGRELVRLEADNPKKGMNAYFLFDPANYWCLLECEVNAGNPEIGKTTFRMKNEIEIVHNLPVIKKYTFLNETKAPGVADIREGEQEFDLRLAHNVPDLDLTMTAFGLPEPHGIVWPTPTRWYIWFMGIAAASVGLGWYLRRRVVARNNTTPTVKPKPSAARALS